MEKEDFVLAFAAQEGNIAILKLLIAKTGKNINTPMMFGDTLLHIAVEYGQIEVVKFLISNGALINSKSESGKTPLHKAAGLNLSSEEATIEIIKILISNKASLNLKDSEGKGPLELAKHFRKTEIIKLLETYSSI